MVFETIEKRIETIEKILGLSNEEREKLLSFYSIKHKTLQVSGRTYDAWRIQHSNALGPGKGGIRYHPNVCEDEVKSLAFWMSIKNSLLGLPYGGGKGGIQVNPKELNEKELEELSRAYIRAFHDVIGQDIDIPAPDMNTNGKIMAWMLDEFEKIKGRHEPGAITGKPVELGGLVIREPATADGCAIVFDAYLQKTGQRLKTIAVQGFGNTGMHFARVLYAKEYKIVAVSDSKGGVYDEKGIDITHLIQIKKEKDRVGEYGGKKITNEELLMLDVDLLVLAALENQITGDNVSKIRAKTIIELANGPITPEADEALYNRGTTVIPDSLANAGGVVTSYFEWCNNRAGNIFDEEFFSARLKKMMTEAFNQVYKEAQKHKTDLRTAAYLIGIERILAAEKARGK